MLFYYFGDAGHKQTAFLKKLFGKSYKGPFGFCAIIWRCVSNEVPLAISHYLTDCWWENVTVLKKESFSARTDYIFNLFVIKKTKFFFFSH